MPRASAPYAFVSPLDCAPRSVTLAAGDRMAGFRLRPGTVIDPSRLFSALEGAHDLAAVHAAIEETCLIDPDLDRLITALAQPDARLSAVARQEGVSVRRVQRLFARHRCPSPAYWMGLGRARYAAAHLGTGTLADISCRAGYSDQAHMTREFRRWFGYSPAALKRQPTIAAQLGQPGLATMATGEQISIR